MRKPTPYGTLLRRRRIDAGLSLRDVAERLHVSHVYLADVERGARGPLQPEHEPKLKRIIKGLTSSDLARAREASRPVKITLETTPERWEDVTIALARRYARGNLREDQREQILRILQEDEED